MQDYLVVGLGNPGSLYNFTRHNIGFFFIDSFAEIWKSPAFVKKNPLGLYTVVQQPKFNIHLLKPLTFVNASGKAILSYMTALGILSERVLVLVDDLDLPIGKTRLRISGSSGTHNGLRSISDSIGEYYSRLRFGIRPIGNVIQGDLSDFVLSKFVQQELDVFKALLKPTHDGLMAFLNEGPSIESVQKYQIAFSQSLAETNSMTHP